MSIKPTKLEIARDLLKDSILEKDKKIQSLIHKAQERINFKTIKSSLNLPATANSAVDGYGILHKTFLNNPKTEFQIAGVAKAGHPFKNKILPHQAIEIYTGAIMPEGVDSVVMHEKCKKLNNRVIINEKVKKNQNMRPIGENLKRGEIVVKKGKLLNAADIGQLAASGNNKIDIYEKLNVSVISTGDELISTETENRLEGQIYDSNKPMLLSLLDHKFLNIHDLGIVKDNRNELAKKFADALSKSDVVISSGGASDGIEDHTQNAIRDVGAECLVWQLAMKPGKPMAIGRKKNKIIFCLPGNPVAAFVCSKLLIKPLLIKLAGGVDLEPLVVKIPSGFEHKKRKGRAEYLRAKIISKKNGDYLAIHGRKGAGVISSLTGADGIVEIPMDYETVNVGQLLKFYPFEHRCL
mgnify:FL=1